MAEEKKEKGKLFKEFKAFISRGNVLDMAVGVIIGGAFNAIVNALVKILMSVCTWGVPGGINGLVTVLPAANSLQDGPVGQMFYTDELASKVVAFAQANGATNVVDANSDAYVQWQNTLLGKYTLHGNKYTYNFSAVIDWGGFINAVISFLIIALTLFVIIKVFNKLQAKRHALEDKLKHNDEAKEEAQAE